MISLCSSLDNTVKSNSKERLVKELAIKDSLIETLQFQMQLLNSKKKRNKQSIFHSFSRRFSLSKSPAKGELKEYSIEYDSALESLIINDQLPRQSEINEEKPRARSCSEMLLLNHSQLFESSSFWNMRSASSHSLLLAADYQEHSYQDIINDRTNGSTNLDDAGCLLVYGCPKELVHLLKPGLIEERKRRWLLCSEYVQAMNKK